MKIQEALAELRKEKARKFDQSIDLIVNLKGLDLKKESVNVVAQMPHAAKEKNVCGFLTKKSSLVKTVLEPDFAKYKEQKALRLLVKEFDFFIASAPLMPKVATIFGKVLGPAGKMPSPQLGILTSENDNAIKEVLEKIGKSVKLRAKEPSIKLSIGKISMDDSKIAENAKAVYHALIQALPIKNENVKNVLIKLTMGKPLKVEM